MTAALRAALRALRAALVAVWVRIELRDVFWFGGLALFAWAPSWRLAVVGLIIAAYASFGGALVARLARKE